MKLKTTQNVNDTDADNYKSCPLRDERLLYEKQPMKEQLEKESNTAKEFGYKKELNVPLESNDNDERGSMILLLERQWNALLERISDDERIELLDSIKEARRQDEENRIILLKHKEAGTTDNPVSAVTGSIGSLLEELAVEERKKIVKSECEKGLDDSIMEKLLNSGNSDSDYDPVANTLGATVSALANLGNDLLGSTESYSDSDSDV